MNEKQPLVAIVVANFNGESSLYKSKPVLWYSLSSIKRIGYKNYKCILADDSSTDNSVRYVKTHFPWVKIVIKKPNSGYAATANNGARYALKYYNPDYVLFLNNDIIVTDKEWLTKLVSTAEKDKSIGIVGCKFLYPNGNLQHAGEYMKFGIVPRTRGWNTPNANRYNEIEEVEVLAGVVFLVRRALIKKVGLFDENFRMGNDDVEYCIRARKARFKVIYNGKTSITHLENFTSKSIADSKRNKDFWFPIFQYQYMYLAFKHFNPVQILGEMAIILLSGVVSIGTRPLMPTNFRLKNRIPWRLLMSLKAINVAYKLHAHKMTKEEAYDYFAHK
jgi:GT2 family glycosyltransferase